MRAVTRAGLGLALGLMGVSLSGCGGEARADVVRTIRIEHSRFVPSSLKVKAGETVRFLVVNDDPIDHELLIGDDDAQSLHESGTEAQHGDKPGEISVPALSSAETSYTFGAPGKLIFGCHLPGHYSYGMRGEITVSD